LNALAMTRQQSTVQARRVAEMDFTASCFPVKIKRASAGWTRAVASIED